MSHIVVEETLISNPDIETLRQACQIVADNHGGEVTSHYLNYSGQRCTPGTNIALILPDMFRGIGLQLAKQTGKLEFVGDSWGVKPLYQQVQSEIVQAYTTLATMKVLQEMGYVVNAAEDTSKQNLLLLQGVCYG
jgi:hypothetical protein